MTIRVRFAPSPTGTLHIGTARTALFNWLYAKNQGGSLILRIEDTDLLRSESKYTNDILESLKRMGLDWDEGPGEAIEFDENNQPIAWSEKGDYGPYFQNKRQEIYKRYAQILLDKGLAYPCFCDPESLKQRRENAMARGFDSKYDGHCRHLDPEAIEKAVAQGQSYALRFKLMPGETKFTDLLRGPVTFNHQELDDFVLVKKDGNPTYNFAVTVDDSTMEITHIIRGDDHISNTPKQILLYQALGTKIPKFIHVPLILGPDRTKLSKRHGAQSLNQYLDEGFLPQTLLNFLATMGASYKEGQEIFLPQELIQHFSLKKLSKTAAIFDSERLKWLNGEHFVLLDIKLRIQMIQPFIREKYGDFDDEYITKIVDSFGKRLRSPQDLLAYGDYFFTDDFIALEEAKENLNADSILLMEGLCARFEKLDIFDEKTTEGALREFAKDSGVKAGVLIHPLRAAISGKVIGPSAFLLLEILGKKPVIERLKRLKAQA